VGVSARIHTEAHHFTHLLAPYKSPRVWSVPCRLPSCASAGLFLCSRGCLFVSFRDVDSFVFLSLWRAGLQDPDRGLAISRRARGTAGAHMIGYSALLHYSNATLAAAREEEAKLKITTVRDMEEHITSLVASTLSSNPPTTNNILDTTCSPDRAG
jgi:hypothetical protein